MTRDDSGPGHQVTSEPIFTTTRPDGTASIVDLSTPGAYQDFAFEATHATGAATASWPITLANAPFSPTC